MYRFLEIILKVFKTVCFRIIAESIKTAEFWVQMTSTVITMLLAIYKCYIFKSGVKSERLRMELSAHPYGGVKNTQSVCLEKVLRVI